MHQLYDEVKGRSGASQASIFLAHVEFLEDPELVRLVEAKIETGGSAGWAWEQTIEERVDHAPARLRPLAPEFRRVELPRRTPHEARPLEPADAVIATLKPSDDRRAIIVRLFNPDEKAAKVTAGTAAASPPAPRIRPRTAR